MGGRNAENPADRIAVRRRGAASPRCRTGSGLPQSPDQDRGAVSGRRPDRRHGAHHLGSARHRARPMLNARLTAARQRASDPPTSSLVNIQSGKLRALAVASATRTPALPDVPTTTDAGYPKRVAPFWLGVLAPAGTPPAIVAKLN